MKAQVLVGTGASASSTAPSPSYRYHKSNNSQCCSDDGPAGSSPSSASHIAWCYGHGRFDFPVRRRPDIWGQKTGAVLHPGAIFYVRREEVDQSGRRFLELADGTGWVFDGVPGFGMLFYPLDETSIDGEEEGEQFDLDAACEQAAIGLSKQLDPRLGGVDFLHGLWRTCRTSCDTDPDGGEFRLVVESESIFPQMLDVPDSLDITFTPRAFEGLGAYRVTMTAQQHSLREKIELPEMAEYPLVPGLAPIASQTERKHKLTQIFRDFVSDLHTGMYLTQLTSAHDYAEIHCQLVEDLSSLRLDQCTGRIVEFPLTDVSRLYHIAVPVNADQIVVMEFVRRKLAFVFKDRLVSQRFQLCMELLVRLAIVNEDATGVPPQEEGSQKASTNLAAPTKSQRNDTTGPAPAQVVGSLPRTQHNKDEPSLKRENNQSDEKSSSEEPPPPPQRPPQPPDGQHHQEHHQEHQHRHQQQQHQSDHQQQQQVRLHTQEQQQHHMKPAGALPHPGVKSPMSPVYSPREETDDDQGWGSPVAVEI